MTAYAALIRGIGPGDPRKSNDSLRAVLEELGFTGVRPVISSGNVVFESDEADPEALGDRIEAAWPELRGFSATTIVRSKAQLEHLVERLPFGDLPHGPQSYQLVTFFKQPVAEAATPPPELSAVRTLGLVDGALCSVNDTTLAGTPDVMKWVEKTYGKALTSRTPLTLRRILGKMP